MTTNATLLQFAAEVSLFLVAVAGLVLAARRDLVGRDRTARGLLVAGFLVLAGSAFVQGTLAIDRVEDRGPLLVLRLSGAMLLLLGALGWSASRWSRRWLVAGIAGVAIAAIVDGSGSTTTVDVVLLASAGALGASLVVAGRRSIPVRIGTSAAALLLLVVLAVSLAVSVVLTRNVEDEALRRYGSRTTAETEAATDTARSALVTARLVGAALAGGDRAGDLLAFQDGTTAQQRAQARTNIASDLEALTGERLLSFDDPVVYVSPDGTPEVASPDGLGDLTRIGLAGDDVVVDARTAQGPRQGVSIVGNEAYGVAAVPLLVRPSGRPQRVVGVLVVAVHLDDTYLRVRRTAGEPLSFSLVSPAEVVAASGGRAPTDVVLAAGQRALARSRATSEVVDGRFVVARPIGAEATPQSPAELALVTTVPTAVVDEARDALFRNLFLVVLGATLVSVAGAALMGERIGGGLRRLIVATERLQAGDLDARAGVRRDDELGVLGASFDAMAASLRSTTDELRRSAADEARLRARLEAVFAGMGEALVACDRDRSIVECNRAAGELLGLDPVAVKGRPIDDVVRFTPGDQHETAGVAAPVDGVTAYDGSVWTGSGQVPVHVTAGPLRGEDDRVVGAVFVLRDMRRERQAEQAKADLLATISHELRTPLTPIKGYAGMLRRRGADAGQAVRFADEISGGVDRLERVIDQLVNFATVSGGPLDLDRTPVRVDDIVDGALERARAAGRGSDRVLHRDVQQVSAPVSVDAGRLGQALDELVDNAVKYSPPGSTVTIGAELSDDAGPVANGSTNGNGTRPHPGPWLRVRVSDEGEGLDATRLAELSSGFIQGDGSATRRVGGLGLGLALADRIARAHGGVLMCRSQVGAGATFTILVPVGEASGEGHLVSTVVDAPAPPTSVVAPTGAAPRPGRGARWLRRLWPVPAALAIAAAVALVPDWGSAGPAPGEARATIEGSARVERSDGTVEVLTGRPSDPAETTLRSGDGFALVAGEAELELAGSIRMGAIAGTDLVMGRTPDLRAGDLLVTGEDPVTVSAGGTRVRLDAAADRPAALRVARTAGLSVGLYRGTATIDSAGSEATVRALRRVEVPALGEVTGAQPVRYDTADAWDRRYLADAMALDQQLARVLPGYERSAGADAGAPATLASVLRGIDGMPSRSQLAALVDPDRPVGDLLVGSITAGLADGGSYATKWRATFRFRDAGASWGLVALDRGVAPPAVLDVLGRVIEASDLDFEDQAGTPGGPVIDETSDPTDPTGTPTTTGGGDGGSGDGSGGGDGDGPTTPTLPPVPTVPTTPTVPTIPPVTDPVGGLVDGLGDVVDGVLDGVGDTVDGVLGPETDDPPDCLLGLLCA